MLEESRRTLHLLIQGHVQGVGFRFSMQRAAELRHVVGWVRNRSDGSVEAVVQGSPDAVTSIVDWSHHGPRGARVEAVDVQSLETADWFTWFEIRG
jgi:acylphosphatase